MLPLHLHKATLGMLQRVPGSAKHLDLLWGEGESGKAGMRGIREEGGVVGKETTPDAQAALASSTDSSATRAGRHLGLESWWDEAADWLGWPVQKMGSGNHHGC